MKLGVEMYRVCIIAESRVSILQSRMPTKGGPHKSWPEKPQWEFLWVWPSTWGYEGWGKAERTVLGRLECDLHYLMSNTVLISLWELSHWILTTISKLKTTVVLILHMRKEQEALRYNLLNTTWLINLVLELEESDSGLPDLNLLYNLRLNFPGP